MRTRQTDALLTEISALREVEEKQAADLDYYHGEVEKWKTRAESMAEGMAALRRQVLEEHAEVERLTRERDELQSRINNAQILLGHDEPWCVECLRAEVTTEVDEEWSCFFCNSLAIGHALNDARAALATKEGE